MYAELYFTNGQIEVIQGETVITRKPYYDVANLSDYLSRACNDALALGGRISVNEPKLADICPKKASWLERLGF